MRRPHAQQARHAIGTSEVITEELLPGMRMLNAKELSDTRDGLLPHVNVTLDTLGFEISRAFPPSPG